MAQRLAAEQEVRHRGDEHLVLVALFGESRYGITHVVLSFLSDM
jgi:hypothetical protein